MWKSTKTGFCLRFSSLSLGAVKPLSPFFLVCKMGRVMILVSGWLGGSSVGRCEIFPATFNPF